MVRLTTLLNTLSERLKGQPSLHPHQSPPTNTSCQHIFTADEYITDNKDRLDLVLSYVSRIKIHVGWGSASEPHPTWTFKKS